MEVWYCANPDMKYTIIEITMKKNSDIFNYMFSRLNHTSFASAVCRSTGPWDSLLHSRSSVSVHTISAHLCRHSCCFLFRSSSQERCSSVDVPATRWTCRPNFLTKQDFSWTASGDRRRFLDQTPKISPQWHFKISPTETYLILQVLAPIHIFDFFVRLSTCFFNFGENSHLGNPCQYRHLISILKVCFAGILIHQTKDVIITPYRALTHVPGC